MRYTNIRKVKCDYNKACPIGEGTPYKVNRLPAAETRGYRVIFVQ